jgi:hypothetical protein
MARTIEEIYNALVEEKERLSSLNALQPAIDDSQTLLTNLTTSSKVAIWRLLLWVVAFGIWTHEKVFDLHKQEIEARANELITGVPLWYRDQSLVFQYGDALVWNGKKYLYDPIDLNKRIIKRCSVIEAAGQVRIKVAKLTSDVPSPLSTEERTAFLEYIQKIKFAGTNVAIISEEADKIRVYYKIKRDPLVLASNGELISTPGTFPVNDAIESYIKNLPFDGVFSVTQLTDAVQKAVGVVDPVLISAEAKYGSLAYQNIEMTYESNAGHMAIDEDFPLEATITYV